MKKLLSLFLVLLMVVSVFAACSGPAETKPQGDQGKTEANKTDEKKTDSNLDEWGRPYVPSSLSADLNFADETVNIYIDKAHPSDFFVEEYNDDLINDSVYDRNIKVEEDLGVKLNFLVSDASPATTNFTGEIEQIVSAGTNDYDIVAGYAYFLTSGVRGFTFANLLDMPNLYLENPWWNQSYINEATLADQLYTITGDISLSTTYCAGCMFFNKRLADEEYAALGGSDHIYQLVLDGKWTIDAFTDLVKGVYREVDGDGVPSNGDFYGYGTRMAGPVPGDPFMFGMQATITKDNAEGIPEFVFNSQKTIDALHKLYVLCTDSEGVLFDNANYNSNEFGTTLRNKFINGEMIFYTQTLSAANSFLEMKDDFGLLPMPKFDENQNGYYTSQADGYSLIAIPAGIEVSERAEMVGATLEKLCEESYRTVNPNYFEVVMKYRYIRSDDEEDFDLKMYDLILEGNGFNFGLIFSSALDNPSFAFRHILGRDGSENFASYWSSKETSVNRKFKSLVEWFQDI